MCCLTTIILVFGSRLAIVFWWLADQPLFNLAFKNLALPGSNTLPLWVWPLLGLIFLPWTTLAFLFVFPGGIVGYEWIVLGVAFLVDLFGHAGSYHHRNRIPRYRRSEPIL